MSKEIRRFAVCTDEGDAPRPKDVDIRRSNALQLKKDSIEYLSNKIFSDDLGARIEKLKKEERHLTNLQCIEILLDFVERELEATQQAGILQKIYLYWRSIF